MSDMLQLVVASRQTNKACRTLEAKLTHYSRLGIRAVIPFPLRDLLFARCDLSRRDASGYDRTPAARAGTPV